MTMSRARFNSESAEHGLGRQAEERAQHDIDPFLHAQRVGHEEGGAARGIEQAFDGQHRRQAQGHAHERKRDPGLDAVGDPAGEMQRETLRQARRMAHSRRESRLERSACARLPRAAIDERCAGRSLRTGRARGAAPR